MPVQDKIDQQVGALSPLIWQSLAYTKEQADQQNQVTATSACTKGAYPSTQRQLQQVALSFNAPINLFKVGSSGAEGGASTEADIQVLMCVH